MLKSVFTAAGALALGACISFAAEAPARGIDGSYIEARTADVWTGPCFANGEVEINGKEAILGWKINQGAWQGVDLAGLAVVGVVRTEHTLGNVSEPVNPGRAVLIVDSHASPAQAQALEAFAKSMSGDLLNDVVKVYSAPIELTIANDNIHGGAATLTAGSLAEVETRALNGGDVHCGNEMVFYPPLSANLEHAMPAFAETDTYQGGGLDERWKSPNRRSSFLGIFHVDSGATE
ncbi:MAG: DUF1326 domain-containing protein [Bryobacteraceae bacterium]|jgi:hypothetical protein